MQRLRMTLAGVVGVLVLSAAPASAVPFTVNSPADTSDAAPGNGVCATPAAGPPVCTLRAAVEETNALAGADSINLPAGNFAVLSPSPATEFGDLRVTDHLTIGGAGPGATVIEGLGPEGVFFFTGTLNVTLRDLRITGGEDDFGAALQFQAGELTMERVDVSGNTGTGTNPDGIVTLAAAFGTANATIRDSTFRNNTVGTTAGDGVIAQQSAVGGDLTVTGSTFAGNRVAGGFLAGGVIDFTPSGPAGTLTVDRSIFVDNVVGRSGAQGDGAAIFIRPDDFADATASITNSTFAGNSAPGGAGGAIFNQFFSSNSSIAITNSTFDRNSAGSGGALALQDPAIVTHSTISNNSGDGIRPLGGTLRHSIVAGNAPRNCSESMTSGGFNLEQGSSCGLAGSGDKRGDPLLAPLASNGGAVPTRAPSFGSAAVDGGQAKPCLVPLDARGVARPQGTHCDIGAFEGSLRGPSPPADKAQALPAPVLGRTFNAVPLKGSVFVSLPPRTARAAQSVPGLKGRRFVPLREARQLPVGSMLDSRRGTVRLTSARDTSGRVQSGDFAAGVFQVLQSSRRSARGLTELRLKGSIFRACRRASRRSLAETAARRSRRTIRRVRGNARGRFRTRGRHAAATVRGTTWSTADRCDGTLIRVSRGRVAVRDLRRNKNVTLRAGKSYLARAP